MLRAAVCVGLIGIICAGCGRPGGPPAPPVSEISATKTPQPGAPIHWEKDDWPQWRGSEADGISTGKPVPVSWKDGSPGEHIVWKQALPGHGHSSPIIVGEQVYVETADEAKQSQSILCLNREDGMILWEKALFSGKLEQVMHRENTQATSTLAFDGQHLFALFLNDRKIWALALDHKGDEVWRKEVGGFTSKFGYSASPVLYESLLIVAADHQSGGFLAALDRKTGDIVWRKKRPAESSYASPRVIKAGGQAELVICGCNLVAAYNPLTGDQLWTTKGTASAAVGTIVTTDDLLFASGGYPERDTVALKPNGDVVWRNGEKSYVPSLLAYQGSLYMVNDDGIAFCYDANTGKERWKKRIGGNFRTSPVLNNGHIFTTDMSGKTTVFRANPAKFELVAENQLGTECFASPGISNGRMFIRVADNSSGTRQDWMYCIGEI